MEGGNLCLSQSIDERIVEMQFRNDQFERGIRESRNSLDKLKDSLNLEKSTGGIGALGKAFDNLSDVSLPSVQTALEHVGSSKDNGDFCLSHSSKQRNFLRYEYGEELEY